MVDSHLLAPTELAALASMAGRLPASRSLAEAERRSVHFVGGVVRDALLGRPAKDIDLVVDREGESFAQRLARQLGVRLVRLGGERFAAFRLPATQGDIDIWDRQGDSLEADLARRDFTVDAMAVPLAAETALIDPHGGLADLRARRLCATTPSSFREDPLRVLRLARLVGELGGFSVEAETLSLARASAAGLSRIAAERIRDELGRLLACNHATEAFLTLESSGGGWALFGAHAAAAAAPAAVASTDRACRQLADAGIPVDTHDRARARLASVALAIAPREAGRLLEQLAAAGRLGRRDAREATSIVQSPAPSPDEVGRRRFLHSSGTTWRAVLAFAVAHDRIPLDELEALASLESRCGGEIRSPAILLRGSEIAELANLAPGPQLGALVARLRAAQVDGSVQNRDEAVAWLKNVEVELPEPARESLRGPDGDDRSNDESRPRLGCGRPG